MADMKRFYPLLVRWLGGIVLLTLLFAQMELGSRRKSAAFDETYHFVSGYAFLRTGDPRLSWEHPPLPQVLAALPTLGMPFAPFPQDHPGWQSGYAEDFVDEYLWETNAALAPPAIWAGRRPLMLLTLGIGAGLFAALWLLVGEPAAWVGALLFACDPNVIANGSLIGNDLPAAGFMALTVGALGLYFRSPNRAFLLLTGCLGGLALGCKLTAGMLAPAALVLAACVPDAADQPPTLRLFLRRCLALLAMGGAAVLTLWAVFGFEVGPLTAGGWSIPLPTYLSGLPRMARRVVRGTPTFLLGRRDENGWWYYFLATFLLKTPLPTLILLALGIIRAIPRWRATALWWIPALLYFGVASFSTLQIGYRYILPALLFGLALAASQFRAWPTRRWPRLGLIALCGWAVFEAAWVFPDHLAYSNELLGGPDQTWRYFADMNVDWGTDLVALREYMAAHPQETVWLSYFGSASPAAYGVAARLLPGFSRVIAGPEYQGFNPYTPEPGTYALSATALHLGLIYEGRDLYAYFRGREPDARAGRSILIYRVTYPAAVQPTRAVVVGPTVWRQSLETLGAQAGTRLIVKWSGAGAVVLPGGGPARFVVGAETPRAARVQAALASGDARALLAQLPASSAPTTPAGRLLRLPAAFAGGPALAGWEGWPEQAALGETLLLTTYWRITGPLTPPLAVFVHLLGPEDRLIAQWDGWPVSSIGLEAGDGVALEHPLPIPRDAPAGEYRLQIGLYRPPNGPRLLLDAAADADRLYLGALRVAD